MKIPLLFAGFGLLIVMTSNPSPIITFVGSTPADPSVRQSLNISRNEKCDFIRWKLQLNQPTIGRYKLEINYGEGQPNTPGFWGGGQFATLTGKYGDVGFSFDNEEKQVLELIGDSSRPLYLLKLDDNLLHVLTPKLDVMIGTGGWSYTLTRTEGKLLSRNNKFPPKKDTATKITYHGRTPCQEIVQALGIKKASDCRKLKWSITLKKDPVTLEPAGYILRGTLIRQYIDPKDSLLGNWSIVKGNNSHPEAIIYKLDITATKRSLYLMNIDNSIVLFLNDKKEILNGDKDFSYTINRKTQ